MHMKGTSGPKGEEGLVGNDGTQVSAIQLILSRVCIPLTSCMLCRVLEETKEGKERRVDSDHQ